MMKWKWLGHVIFLFATIFGASSVLAASTYYVDFSSGSDSNDGTSKSTPWQHAPGMAGCSNVCASTASSGLKPGDSVILKGGVTWHNAAMSWSISWSGTANSPIYFGVDKSWYSGGSWTRPILNGDGAIVTGNGKNNVFINANASYIQIDNFEFTGLYWNSSYDGYGQSTYIAHWGNAGTVITNNYFHGWSHATAASGTSNAMRCIQGTTLGSDPLSYAAYNVFDGSDTDGVSGTAMYGSPYTFYENYCGHMANCFVTGLALVHDNVVEYLTPMFDGGHSNGIESLGDVPVGQWNTTYAGNGIGAVIYNNVVRHVAPGVTAFLAGANNNSDVEYVFNNIIYDTGDGNVMDITNSRLANQSEPFGSFLVVNNTVECGSDVNPDIGCSINVNKPLSPSNFETNHYITSLSAPNGGSAIAIDQYVVQSKSAATGQGYSSSETYAFSPASSSGATVGADGYNKTSVCNSNTLLAPLCQDTTYAVSYNTSDHTVSFPARTPVNRPESGAWDAGAYQYSASSTSAPVLAPPTDLAATVKP
jgi:hypothetical protein